MRQAIACIAMPGYHVHGVYAPCPADHERSRVAMHWSGALCALFRAALERCRDLWQWCIRAARGYYPAGHGTAAVQQQAAQQQAAQS